MASQNEQVLRQYGVGEEIEFEHPDGSGTQSATIITFTADKSKRDGAMLKFQDGAFIDVSASYLERKETKLLISPASSPERIRA